MTRDVPAWATSARAGWRHTGAHRPAFAVVPAPGQESVWDYPRPPRLAPDRRAVRVRGGSYEVARTRRSVRVLETASPPTFYLPPDDVRLARLAPAPGRSRCEWKGEARYWRLADAGDGAPPVAWSYPDPLPGFEPIRSYFAFYPSRLECRVEGVRVGSQPGDFYGGWVTPEIVGPFKGDPGSAAW